MYMHVIIHDPSLSSTDLQALEEVTTTIKVAEAPDILRHVPELKELSKKGNLVINFYSKDEIKGLEIYSGAYPEKGLATLLNEALLGVIEGIALNLYKRPKRKWYEKLIGLPLSPFRFQRVFNVNSRAQRQ
jgi:hypothetical protein